MRSISCLSRAVRIFFIFVSDSVFVFVFNFTSQYKANPCWTELGIIVNLARSLSVAWQKMWFKTASFSSFIVLFSVINYYWIWLYSLFSVCYVYLWVCACSNTSLSSPELKRHLVVDSIEMYFSFSLCFRPLWIVELNQQLYQKAVLNDVGMVHFYSSQWLIHSHENDITFLLPSIVNHVMLLVEKSESERTVSCDHCVQ